MDLLQRNVTVDYQKKVALNETMKAAERSKTLRVGTQISSYVVMSLRSLAYRPLCRREAVNGTEMTSGLAFEVLQVLR